MILAYKKSFTLFGFSLGANLVLKLAGEYKEKYPNELKFVCAISPPFDLLDSAKAMQKKQNKIYHDFYFKKIYQDYIKMSEYHPNTTDLNLLKKVKNLYDVDDYLIAHHFGFENAVDYYRKVSSIYFMDKIKVDTLIIHAKDDPIIPIESYQKIK